MKTAYNYSNLDTEIDRHCDIKEDEPRRMTEEEYSIVRKLAEALEDYSNTSLVDEYGSMVEEMREEVQELLEETGMVLKLNK